MESLPNESSRSSLAGVIGAVLIMLVAGVVIVFMAIYDTDSPLPVCSGATQQVPSESQCVREAK